MKLMEKQELNKKIEEIKVNAEKKVMREQIKLLEENITIVKKQYKEKTGEDYDKKEDFAMDRVLKAIYGKGGIVSKKEFQEIAQANGYDIRGASSLYKIHLVMISWHRVALTPVGQSYVELQMDAVENLLKDKK